MLIRPRNIFETNPPFLIVFGNGQWKVARQLFPHPEGVAYLEPFSEHQDAEDPDGVIPGSPWHVGDNVWEMDYNTQIMTLDHPHQHRHPGWRLWLHWLSSGGGEQASHRH
jgi:hypothetical protein